MELCIFKQILGFNNCDTLPQLEEIFYEQRLSLLSFEFLEPPYIHLG